MALSEGVPKLWSRTRFFWHFAALCLLQGISRTCQKRFECSVPSNTWTADERLPNSGAERSPSSKLLGRALDPHGEANLEIVEFSMPCWPDPLGKAYHRPIHAGAERTPLGNSWDGLECFSSEGPTMRLEATVSHCSVPFHLENISRACKKRVECQEKPAERRG